MTDVMKKADDEAAAALAAINQRRTALGLEAFAALDNDAVAWADANMTGEEPEAEAPKAAEEKPPVKTDEPAPAGEPAKAFSVPAVFKPEQTAGSADGEIERMRQEIQSLKSEKGRSSVLAKEVKDLQAALAEAERKVVEAERKAAEAAGRSTDAAILSTLTQEDIDELGGNTKAAEVILKVAKQVAAHSQNAAGTGAAKEEIGELRKRLEERERLEAEAGQRAHDAQLASVFANVVDKVVPQEVYGTFQSNPKWAEWSAQKTFGIPNWQHYSTARDDLDGNGIAALFQKFMAYAGIAMPAKGSKQPPLRVEAKTGSEAPVHAADDGSPQNYKFEEVSAIMRSGYLGKLPSGWNWQKFGQQCEIWEKAAADGRVLDKAGVPRIDLT